MKVNFKITECVAVEFEDAHIDLHNNFELVGISKQEDNASMCFQRVFGDWVKEDEFASLTFRFLRISFEYEKEGGRGECPNDERVLSFISFLPSVMRDINDAFMDRGLPEDNDDILFCFEDGRVFRVNCEEIRLQAKR